MESNNLHDDFCKQESRISKLEASDLFQNKQLDILIKKMEKSIEIQTKQLAIQEEQATNTNQFFNLKSGLIICIVGAIIVVLFDSLQFLISHLLHLFF